MKNLYTFLCCLFTLSLAAQLPDGSIAPNFSLPDLNGDTHELYDYLDDGYSVVLDFSATWCGPCWNYHQSGVLEDLYDEWGPDGEDKVMVFMIEADPATSLPCIYGPANCSGGSIGDWTAGVSYPILNPEAPDASNVNNSFAINYFPTLYGVSPAGDIYEIGQSSLSEWESWTAYSFQMHNTTWETNEECETSFIDLQLAGGYGDIEYEWSNGATTQDLFDINPGEYFVTITDDHNYEVVKGPIEVESNNGAEVELIEISNVLCEGESNGYIEIDVSGGSQNFDFQWSDGSSDQNLSNVPAGTYELSVIDADTGCAYEMEFEIEEPEVLEYELEIEEPECNGNTLGEIEFFVEGGTWPMNFIFEDFETQSELITLEPGLYTVTIMDDNGCSVITPEFEIVNQEAPVAVSSAVGQFNCVQDTVYVTAESSSTGSDIAYSWFAPNLTYLGNSAVLQIDSSGLYTLEVTNTNSGCVSYSQVMVSEDYNVPVAVANVLNNIDCSNVTAMISAQGSTADSSVVYTWTTTTGNILSDPASSEIEVASAGFYDLTVNNIYSGCVSNATVEVLSVDLPEIELSGDAEFCQGNFTTICINQNTDEEVSWFVDGNLIANSVCVDVDASFELEVVLSNTITGCEATEFVAIEALEAPEIELLGDLIFCSGTTSTICLDNSNNNDVVWRQNGMEIGTDNCITLDATGQIEVTLTNTTTGCASEEAFNTEVYMNPVIEIAEPAILDCSLTSVELDLTVDSETELFAWYDGQNILLSNSEDLTVTQAGNYTVVATNIYGCESVSSVNVEANLDELPIAEYSFTSDQFSFNFEDKSQGNIKSWLWDFGDGNSSTEQNPSYTYANAGFYTVVLTTSNDCGTSKITQEVLATSPMQITTVVNNVSCSGYSDGSIQLSVYGGLPTYSYNWSGPSNGLLGPQAAGLSSGSYHIEITDAAGMSISAEIELLEPDPIVVGADITPAAQGTFDGAIVLEIEGGNGGYSFQWSNGSTSQNLTGLAQGTYTVIVTDEKNCTTEEVFDVLGTTGIEELDFVSKFELSPNPAGDFVNLKIELDELKPVSVRVISVIGQIHHDIEMNTISLEENINLSYLPNGLYVIELRSANQVSIRKLIVSH